MFELLQLANLFKGRLTLDVFNQTVRAICLNCLHLLYDNAAVLNQDDILDYILHYLLIRSGGGERHLNRLRIYAQYNLERTAGTDSLSCRY